MSTFGSDDWQRPIAEGTAGAVTLSDMLALGEEIMNEGDEGWWPKHLYDDHQLMVDREMAKLKVERMGWVSPVLVNPAQMSLLVMPRGYVFCPDCREWMHLRCGRALRLCGCEDGGPYITVKL